MLGFADNSFTAARHQMVERQLAARGIRDPRVLAAMKRVPRERFLPDELAAWAYSDQALSIDCQQTISQPYIVALMTEALRLRGEETVLEVGTGSGYQAAILAELAAQVVTIERHPALFQQAERRLSALGYRNVDFVLGDGSLGYPARAPYQAILAAAAAATLPLALVEQLAPGGRLVLPLGVDEQTLVLVEKTAGPPRITNLGAVRFVPLVESDQK